MLIIHWRYINFLRITDHFFELSMINIDRNKIKEKNNTNIHLIKTILKIKITLCYLNMPKLYQLNINYNIVIIIC